MFFYFFLWLPSVITTSYMTLVWYQTKTLTRVQPTEVMGDETQAEAHSSLCICCVQFSRM